MMVASLKYTVVILLFFVVGSSLAGNAISYHVDVAMEMPETLTQDQAFVKGFLQLAERLPVISTMPHVTPKQLLQTISQYRYQDKDGQSMLSIDFDKKAVIALLDEVSKQNTHVNSIQWVTWLAVMTDKGAVLVGDDSDNAFLSTLQSIANENQLQLIVPEMDLDDMDSVTFEDVWTRNDARLSAASRRYHGNGVLSIKLMGLKEDKWHSSWYLQTVSKKIHFDASDDSIEGLFKQGIARLKKQLAGKGAADATDRVIYLQVSDIHSSQSYQQILTYLQQLSGVNFAQLHGVTPDTVLYKLRVSMSKRRLMRLISKNKTLVKRTKSHDDVIYYRLHT